MKKRTVAFFTLLAALFLAGCAQSAQSRAYSRLVTYRGARYVGTVKAVTAVGEKLGAIAVSSDRESEDGDDLFSNYYPVGTGLYAIPGVDTGTAVAVGVSDGRYIRADRATR